MVDDLAEEGRRDSQVMEGTPGLPEFPAQRSERLDVIVRALDIPQAIDQRPAHGLVGEAVRPQALAGSFREALQIARTGHPHDRQIEALVANQTGQCGEDLLEGKIASGAEKDECVGAIARSGGGATAGSDGVSLGRSLGSHRAGPRCGVHAYVVTVRLAQSRWYATVAAKGHGATLRRRVIYPASSPSMAMRWTTLRTRRRFPIALAT